MSRRILVLVPFCEDHIERLRACAGPEFSVEQYPADLEKAELLEHLKGAEAVIGEPDVSLLYSAPSVKWVQMTWAGPDIYTHNPTPFPAGVRLTNAVGAYGHIISQYAVGQALSIAQNLPGYLRLQARHEWGDLGGVVSFEGARVLIFGAGNIASDIARRLSTFDVAEIVGVCRNTASARPYFDCLCTLDEAERYLPVSDCIFCALPNTAQTKHYLDDARLRQIKPGAILVNVGRGNFIDCAALAQVLSEGHLRGAALDVCEPEPLPAEHPLWDEPRCVLTPHVSGGAFGRSFGTEERICALCCDNLQRWIHDQPLNNVVY